jgi:protein Mpv17
MIRVYFKKYPLLRGVATYAIIWPVSNLCQQTIAGKEKFDFVQALRYSIFGAFYVAPTLHGWLKLSGAMWPQMNMKTALTKVTLPVIFHIFFSHNYVEYHPIIYTLRKAVYHLLL